MKYSYSLQIPSRDEWVEFRSGSMGYCQGYLDAMRGQAPRLSMRMVRSDGRIMDEVDAFDDVNIGMIAGWPTAEQYENAAERALERATKIRERQQP